MLNPIILMQGIGVFPSIQVILTNAASTVTRRSKPLIAQLLMEQDTTHLIRVRE